MKFWRNLLPRFGIGFAAGFLPWLIYRYPQSVAASLEKLTTLPSLALPLITGGIFLASEGYYWRRTLVTPAVAEQPSVPAGWLSPAPKWSLVGGLSAGIAVAATCAGDKAVFAVALTFSICSLTVVWMIGEMLAEMNRSLPEQDVKTRAEFVSRAERLMCLGIGAVIAGVAGVACQVF